MSEIKAVIVLTVAVFASMHAVLADEPNTNPYSVDTFELSDEDLSDITSQVLAEHPLVSSSPGIKYAGAARHRRTHEVAELIYFPHVETAGIKEAFQVVCERQVPDKAWSCDSVEIRRYVSLDSQDFEVRVTGPLTSDEAMVLIEASRAALPLRLEDGSPAPRIATQIIPYRSGYLVIWGTEEGYGRLTMDAHLVDDGDPLDPNAWQVTVYTTD